LAATKTAAGWKGSTILPQKLCQKQSGKAQARMLNAWKHVKQSSRQAAREADILDHRAVTRNEVFRPRQLQLNKERHGPGAKEDGGAFPSSSSEDKNELEFLSQRKRTPPTRPPQCHASDHDDPGKDEDVSQQAAISNPKCPMKEHPRPLEVPR